MTDSLDDLIRCKHKLRAFDRSRRRAAGCIGRTQFHAQALQANRETIFQHHPRRLAEKAEVDTLLARKVVLVLIAAHLAVRAAIDHRHQLRAQPLGNRCAIHCRIAGADHDDIAAHTQFCRGDLAGFDEFQTIDHSLFAGNPQAGSPG